MWIFIVKFDFYNNTLLRPPFWVKLLEGRIQVSLAGFVSSIWFVSNGNLNVLIQVSLPNYSFAKIVV